MNKVKYYIMMLLMIFINSMVSMKKMKINSEHKADISLLDLPTEIIRKIIEEEKYRKVILTWNDIFNEPKFDISQFQGLVESSKELSNIFIELKEFKQKKFNELKEQIKEQYKELSIECLNNDLIKLLNVKTISKKDLKQAAKLILAGANVNATDRYGNTAMMKASFRGYKDIVELLIKINAEVNIKNYFGCTALTWAAEKGYRDIVRILIQAKSNINVKDNDGNTALIYASRNGDIEIVALLLKYDADVHFKDNYGNTALVIAEEKGHKEILEMLIQTQKAKFLMWASKRGYKYKEIIRQLIKEGVNVNCKDSYGNTPLMYASEYGCINVVEMLVKAGADVNARNFKGAKYE